MKSEFSAHPEGEYTPSPRHLTYEAAEEDQRRVDRALEALGTLPAAALLDFVVREPVPELQDAAIDELGTRLDVLTTFMNREAGIVESGVLPDMQTFPNVPPEAPLVPLIPDPETIYGQTEPYRGGI